MKNLLIYNCIFLLLFICCKETKSIHQTSTTYKEDNHKQKIENSLPVFLREPEDSFKTYYKDSVRKKHIDGVDRWYSGEELMDGDYKDFYFDKFDLCYSIARYRDGIKNDTVRFYSTRDNRLMEIIVRPDSIHEFYTSYSSNGLPYIYYEATKGKLDGWRKRWFYDGTPDWFEQYKGGKLNGETRRWFPNGYLSLVERYRDDEKILPFETWYYSQSSDDFLYHLGTKKAPDRYTITYATWEDDTDSYRITENYKIGEDGIKQLYKRIYSTPYDEIFRLTKDDCDSVSKKIIKKNDNEFLEIRDYKKGRLIYLETCPLYFGDGSNICAESYSKDGKIINRYIYDYESETLVPLRIYSNMGAHVKGINHREYVTLTKRNYNKKLNPGSKQFTLNGDSLTLHCQTGNITLLNHDYNEVEAADFSCEWVYDGYEPEHNLHFFHFEGYESWYYFVMNAATGEVTEFKSNSIPVLCEGTNLFLTNYENPYMGNPYIYVYKILPNGRLAQIASLERGGYNFYESDLENFIWIGNRSFVATKKIPTDSNSVEKEFLESLPQYVRIDITPDALKESKPLPLSNRPEELNTIINNFHNEANAENQNH